MDEQQQRQAYFLLRRWLIQDNIEALEVPDKLRKDTRKFIESTPEPSNGMNSGSTK